MKAQDYVTMDAMRRDLRKQERELAVSTGGLIVCILISICSVFTMDWMCVTAAAATILIPMASMLMSQGSIDRLEMLIFRHRCECGQSDLIF